MEPWRTMDAHDGGVEAQNEALEGLKTNGRRFASLQLGTGSGSVKLIRIHNSALQCMSEILTVPYQNFS